MGLRSLTSYSQVARVESDCGYDGSIVNGYGLVSVGYEMGYYYDTSIALVLYDPNNNIVGAETNWTNGYSHAHDSVDITNLTAGTYTTKIYIDAEAYYYDQCGWVDYLGFEDTYPDMVTDWDNYDLWEGYPIYCSSYCCRTLLELSSDDTVVFCQITTAEISADHIIVSLLPTQASGRLDIKAVGTAPDNSAINYQVASETRSGSSSCTYSFTPTQLPVGHYTQITAQWFTGTNPSDAKSVHFYVLGSYEHTQYNTPDESACQGGSGTALLENPPNTCGSQGDTITMLASFITQAWENGSGISSAYGKLQLPWGCSQPFINPSFKQVSTITGQCALELNNGTVARDTTAGLLNCNDQVLIVGLGSGVGTTKTVTDSCPRCIGNNQLDNYTTNSGCTPTSGGGTLGSFTTIRINR